MIPLTLLDVAEAVSGISSPTVDTSAVVAGKCEIDSRLVQRSKAKTTTDTTTLKRRLLPGQWRQSCLQTDPGHA